ncbi:MAG: type IX secretion system membrane protein PorP/SprF [Cytophagaceae bacterium]
MRLRVLLGLLLGVLSVDVSAQQYPQYSQYMFNMLAVNPAYAGSRDVLSATGLFRKQWLTLPGAPTSEVLSIDCPFRKEKIGLGMLISGDKIGVQSTTGVTFSYAYRIRSEKGTLALGLSGGFMQYKADLTSVALSSYPSGTNDPAFQSNINKTLPNFGAGVYYNTDKFYVGFSAPRIINNVIATYKIGNGQSFGREYRHYFLMAGYVFKLSNNLKYKPSFLLKVVEGSPVQLDINHNLWLHDKFAIGFSYRTADAVVAMLELQMTDQFRLGYAFDYSTTKLSKYNSGTHEIMMRYEFGFGGKVITSPRYF